MDWDIYPTPFNECSTVQPDPNIIGDFLFAANNNGFSTSDPYASSSGVSAPFTNLGPIDHGANFDFRFDPLNPGDAFSFNIYYGATGNQEDAEEALLLVSAEAYSFGKPNNGAGGCSDSPNVYIFVS